MTAGLAPRIPPRLRALPRAGVGPGPESAGILLYAVDASAGKWDRATWDGAYWGALAWQSIACEVTEVQARWGATDEAGILSGVSAGEMDVTTYDPERVLDPTNTGSPFYGAVKPGTPVRLVGKTGGVGAVVNPSFELAPPLTGWVATVPALAEQSPITDAPDGGYTLRLVSDGVAVSPAVSQVIAATPGASTTVSVQARCAAGAEARLRVDGLDAANAVVASGLVSGATTAAVFTTLGGPFVVPAGVVKLRLHLYLLGTPAAGLAVRFDAVTLASGEVVAGTGIIDESTYDVAAAKGRIRAVDGIAYLAQAQLPDGAVLPNTMRARARSVVSQVGLGALVPVEGEAPTDPDVDPPVAPHDGLAAPAWEVISRAAEDSLTIVYLGPSGTLRFRSWGALPDSGINLGCPDADSADELWLAGLSTVLSTASAGPVRNSVRAYSAGTTWRPAVTDALSINRYGPRPYDVPRVVPDFANWAARILADRADAGLEVGVGEVRPFTLAELAALLTLTSPLVVRVRDDGHGEVIDLQCGVIGATVGVTAAGWRWQLVTTIPRVEWENAEPPPVIPPEPPPNPYHTETRTYVASSDALLALTSGGAKYGAGAAATLPVGGWQGWTYRSLVRFPSIPWTKVRAIKSATLGVRTTTQVRVGFGNNPKMEVRRITSNWSAGSSSSPSSGNAVVWPGPSTTSAGAKTTTLPGGQNADKAVDVLAMVKAWGPTSIGGSGASQYGLQLHEISGSETYTTEVWPVEQGGAARPVLTLVVEVFD